MGETKASGSASLSPSLDLRGGKGKDFTGGGKGCGSSPSDTSTTPSGRGMLSLVPDGRQGNGEDRRSSFYQERQPFFQGVVLGTTAAGSPEYAPCCLRPLWASCCSPDIPRAAGHLGCGLPRRTRTIHLLNYRAKDQSWFFSFQYLGA